MENEFYKKCFVKSKNKEDFVKLVMQGTKKEKILRRSIMRQYDRMKKKNNVRKLGKEEINRRIRGAVPLNPITTEVFEPEDKPIVVEVKEELEPTHFKLLDITDARKYGIHIDRKWLLSHGFNILEMKWLVKKKFLSEDEIK